MTRQNNGKELGEALLRRSAPMLAVEYDEDGIPKDLKPVKILAFLNKLGAYNMSQPAGKDKITDAGLIGPEGKGFMKTFDAIRLVPRDTEDAASEMGPLRSYGASNPERPADDRRKCFEWDARASQELLKEFERASDRSTHYDALAEQWCDSKPTKEGLAVDMASLYVRREVVTKNATAHGLKDLSEEDDTQLFDRMQKGSVGGWLAGRPAVSAYSVRMQEALVAGCMLGGISRY
jgi:hypothetical protein